MKCRQCGSELMDGSKYCNFCGQTQEETLEPVSQRVFLGDYEVTAFDHEPEEIPLSDGPILDRDHPLSAMKEAPTGRPARKEHLILLALLLMIIGLSAFGVQIIASRRQSREALAASQAAQLKEAEIKEQRDAYLRKYRELLVLAQSQEVTLKTNLDELLRISNWSWLNNIFLDGFYDSMVNKFRDSETFKTMTNRNAAMGDVFTALEEPPAGLEKVKTHALKLRDQSRKITRAFSETMGETTISDIEGWLADFTKILENARAAL